MRDWLIKKLGGHTGDEYDRMVLMYEDDLGSLHESLDRARKNDTPRDPKTGRFVKKS